MVSPNVRQDPSLDADFDLDGDVDGADLLIWQHNFGMEVLAFASDGDADGDGDITETDLGVWKAEFGPPLPAASVPEPNAASFALAAFVAATTAKFAKRRYAIP